MVFFSGVECRLYPMDEAFMAAQTFKLCKRLSTDGPMLLFFANPDSVCRTDDRPAQCSEGKLELLGSEDPTEQNSLSPPQPGRKTFFSHFSRFDRTEATNTDPLPTGPTELGYPTEATLTY